MFLPIDGRLHYKRRMAKSHADTVILGGGTAGAAVAGLLAERSDESILLLEAGPDYGALADGHWPADLIDARALSYSHDWGYDSGSTYPDRVIPFERARVIGGCSAHNGCAAIWGHRADYDAWAAAGNPGWSTAELLPLFREANRRLRVRVYEASEMTPFQQAWLDAASGAGIPVVGDLNDLDQPQGIGPNPVNIADGRRWNTAFAYLDPVRHKPTLRIRGNALVDRLIVEGRRVTAVRVVGPDGPETVEGGRFVLAGGTYGSPAVLLRSGIGPAEELRALGIDCALDLPGVGRNLHDHPMLTVVFAGTAALIRRMEEFAARRWAPEEQTIAKMRSPACAEAFDLHLFPVGGPYAPSPTGWAWSAQVACMTPRSRGWLRLASADPAAAPRIDHRYLSDPDGHDADRLADGVEIARALARQPALRDDLGTELLPGPRRADRGALAEYARRAGIHYYHPVGTCRMGPASDPAAVVDPRGKVHGLDNAFVADAAIMPVIPRANTNVPVVVIAERIAGWLRRH